MIFGRRNAGKSSLLNCLTGQQVSIVSEVAGTTTDTVWKNIELPGVGAAVVGDTAGFDDDGAIGALRVDATRKALARTDIAIILLDGVPLPSSPEIEWYNVLRQRQVPVIPVLGKSDQMSSDIRLGQWQATLGCDVILFSAFTNEGREALIAKIAQYSSVDDDLDDVTYTLAGRGDIVVLVMPQDKQAPKGRLIQPQVLTLRNLLDKHAIPLCCTPEQLPTLLHSLVAPPSLIITDSQIFKQVQELTPAGTKLTSFSVLMARHKGDLECFCEGAKVLAEIPANGRILIAEACSHIPQNEDIGRVKLPRMLRERIGDGVVIDIVSGNDFPDDLTGYDLVIHCGACMFSRRTVMSRVRQAKAQGVAITNYGIAIATLMGIMDKVTL